jgi:pilus assembly protein TadC
MTEENKEREIVKANEIQTSEIRKKKTILSKIPTWSVLFVCIILPILGGLIWALKPGRDDITQVYVWIFFGIGAGVLSMLGVLIILIFIITRINVKRGSENKHI